MRFPPSFLDEIRTRLPISGVVGRRVAWDKRKSQPGKGDFWACCPFHGEKTPSFHADDRRGRYHCFGCGASGDHFTFLVEREGLSFPEAVESLAAEAGLALPDRDADAERREAVRASLYDVMEAAARYFEAALAGPDGGKARAYLRDRGLTPDVQKRFRLGYAPPSRSALKEHLAGKGIGQEQMVEAGLLIAGADIAVSFDRFRDRIIFPIADLRGRVIAFGGRALSPDAQAKYLNSPDTPLFQKGRVLFNVQAARAGARKGGHLIVVEGYVDAIACVAAGFEATVAPLGTALTEEQLAQLWRMADEPILCFDGDEAGLRAAYRAIDTALPHLKPGRSLTFALLPQGRDPDDLIREAGAEAFGAVLQSARPLVEMLWGRETEGRSLETPERRAALQAGLRAAARAIADEAVRRQYELALDERFAARFGWGARRNARSGPGERRRRSEPAAGPSASLLASRLVRRSVEAAAAPNIAEAILLGGLVRCPEIAAERLELLAGCAFPSPPLRRLADALCLALAEEPGIGSDRLSKRLEAEGHSRTLAAILAKLGAAGLSVFSADGDSAGAAALWDDAAHLRLRAGTLSNERQAAALALGREASEMHLTRLRDIQEEDARSLRRDQHEAAGEVEIVHPLKGR
jgi:DNA primase